MLALLPASQVVTSHFLAIFDGFIRQDFKLPHHPSAVAELAAVAVETLLRTLNRTDRSDIGVLTCEASHF